MIELTSEWAVATSREMWKDMKMSLGENPDIGERYDYVRKWFIGNLGYENGPNIHSPLCMYADRLAKRYGAEPITILPRCKYCPLKLEELSHPCDKDNVSVWKTCRATYKNALHRNDWIYETAPLSEIIKLHNAGEKDDEDYKKAKQREIEYWEEKRNFDNSKIDYEAMYKDWRVSPWWK